MNSHHRLSSFLSFLLAAVLPVMTADASAMRTRLKERVEERRAERAGKTDRNGEEMGGDAATCAEWSAKVKKLERVALRRNTGPQPDHADVAYGKEALEKLDVYLPPKTARKAGAPIIVMVHGGGWCVGDKMSGGVPGSKVTRWTPQGFVFVSVNYPMVNEGKDALAQAQHVARAVAFIQAKAADWGGDGTKVILMGHSAGAHLVSLVNADADIRKAQNVAPVLGTVSLDAGAVDVVKQMPAVYDFLKVRYREAFGETEAGWIAASPFHQLERGAAPWLGVCSTTRKDDPCAQARDYVAKSKGLGIDAQVLPQRKSHAEINKEMGEDGAYTSAVERFMATLDPEVKRRLKGS
jgi:arylformamidase